METFIFIIVIVIIIIKIYLEISTSTNKKEMSTKINSLRKFTVTKEIMGDSGLTGIAYDNKRGKICFIEKKDKGFKLRTFLYKDILSSEIFENGNSITKTVRGSQIGGALIGGLALGPVGILLGGLSGKRKSQNKVNKIDLQITVNDSAKPILSVNFLSFEISKNDHRYQKRIDLAREWHSTIEVLIKQADKIDKKKERKHPLNIR